MSAMLLALALAGEPARAGDAIVLIAHPELSELDELTLAELRQLFLGRRTSVSGRRIHCFEPAPGTPLRRAFARLVLERSERDLERYWLEQALSGGPLPPREIPDEAALVARVAEPRGAVAYLGWEALQRLPREGVKVVPLRLGDRLLRPGDPGYPLRLLAPQAPGAARRNAAE